MLKILRVDRRGFHIKTQSVSRKFVTMTDKVVRSNFGFTSVPYRNISFVQEVEVGKFCVANDLACARG